jgi:outer membrane protein
MLRSLRARAVAASLALVAITAVPGLAVADGVAVVDLQGAVLQTEDGIRAQATLKKLFDKRQKDLDAKQEQLAKVKQDIERQAKVLSREAIGRRMEVWQAEMLQLQTVFVDYNKELSKKQAELTSPIVKKMVAVLSKIARQAGYDLVLDSSGLGVSQVKVVLYAAPSMDFSDSIITELNKNAPKKAATN